MEFLNQVSWNNLEGFLSIIVVILAVLGIGYFRNFLSKRIRLYQIGIKNDAPPARGNRQPFIKALLKVVMRTEKDLIAGLSHDLNMFGFIFFMLSFVVSIVQIAVKLLFNSIFITGVVYNIFWIITNIGIALNLLGAIFVLVRRSIGKQPRLERTAKHFKPLLSLLGILLIAAIYQGFQPFITQDPVSLHFAGWPVYLLLSGYKIPVGVLSVISKIAWFLYLSGTAIFLLIIPRTKLFHMVPAFMNIGCQTNHPFGQIKNQELKTDQHSSKAPEGENDEPVFGTKYIENLSPDRLRELDCCAECGRCDVNCPAFLTKKALSPQKLIQAQKNTFQQFKTPKTNEIINSETTEEMVWDCNMCYACENACPALVEHVERVVGLRRNLVLNSGKTLPEFKRVLQNVEKYGNPFGMENSKRADLIRELKLPVLKKGEKVDYVLWIGCHGYFDPRMSNVVKSFAALLQKAGYRIAVLEGETCCGETVRRMGGEYQFQTILDKNLKLFEEYQVTNLLTFCPHCYNSFKKDYPTFGCKVKTNHYLEILPDILNRNSTKSATKKRVFYHDSCYLGRLNSLYNQPRKVINQMSDSYQLIQLPEQKASSLCCGGGGGRIWADEPVQNRSIMLKLAELKEKNIDMIITSCPYCLTMYQDGVTNMGLNIEVKDLLEVAGEKL